MEEESETVWSTESLRDPGSYIAIGVMEDKEKLENYE